MDHKGQIRDFVQSKEGIFRLLNDKKSGYLNHEMPSIKEYQMSLMQQPEHNARSAYSLQFPHDGMPESVLPDANPCLDGGHGRTFNACIPIGQAFPQMLGGITDFRKNLMVTVQTEVSPRDVLQGQGALCVPPDVSHLHTPVEQLERQRQRNRQRMKTLRLDPDFRAQERQRQRQRMFLKRQDPQFREKERVLQRVRVREKRSMLRALESGNGLLERLACPSFPVNARIQSSHGDENSQLPSPDVLTPGPSSGQTPQSNSSLTVYGTLVEGSQLGQHLLLPNNFLLPSHAEHHHHSLEHQHNGDPSYQEEDTVKVRQCVASGSFNFDLCRSNMLPNCKVCMKLYTDLSRHAKGHKRNHRCPTCGRVFRLKQHLKGHLKTHGEKNLSCPHCTYRTCFNFALNRHLILKHSHCKEEVMQHVLPVEGESQGLKITSDLQHVLPIEEERQDLKCSRDLQHVLPVDGQRQGAKCSSDISQIENNIIAIT